MSAKLRKGGRARWVLENVGGSQTVEIPVGFYIDNIRVESVDKVGSGEIGVGTATSALEVATLTVTAGAITTSGTITVGGVGLEVVEDDTDEEVAALIAAETYTGWTTSVDGAVVTFTATGYGNKTNITFTDTDSTGVTATVSTSAGTQSVDVVAAVELPATGINSLTLLKTTFAADQNIYITFSNDSTANVYVTIQKYN